MIRLIASSLVLASVLHVASSAESPILSKWRKNTLKYVVLNTPRSISDLSLVRKLVAKSLNRWARVTPLRFIEVSSPAEADIKISSKPSFHGDNNNFDGAGKVLAHAFFPPTGELHLDNAENFVNLPQPKNTPAGMIDFQNVVTHELGHILGLEHNPDRTNIMYAMANGKRRLGPGDVASIQRAYGKLMKDNAGEGVNVFQEWGERALRSPHAFKRFHQALRDLLKIDHTNGRIKFRSFTDLVSNRFS